MRIGTQLNLPRRSVAGLAKTVVAACMATAGASAADSNPPVNQNIQALSLAMQVSIEQCVDASAVGDLQPIRSKTDFSRMAADGPPPFRIVLNDTFATDAERAGIARWMRIRNQCRKQFELPRTVPPEASAMQAASLQQIFALSRMFHSGVSQLILALYYQELTYGEFARKRYEFARDAAALSSAIDAAALAVDQPKLGQTLQQLLYLRLSWNTYLRQVSARQPRTVHIQGAIYI